MAMESFTKPQGVPVSAAQASSPRASLLSSSAGSSSFPIRAPVTIDSDSDVASYGSDNGFEYDEVKFDNVVEKPVIASLDEESVVSRPFETNPNEDISEESTNSDIVNEIVVSKPFVTYPDEESSGESIGSSTVEKKIVSKSFVTPPNEKASGEKESSSGSGSSVEKIGVFGLSVSIPDRIITMKRVVSRRVLAVNGESLASPLIEDEGGKNVGGETKMVDDIVLSVASPGIQPIATTPLVKEEDGKVVGGDEDFVVSGPFAAQSNEKFSEEKESSGGSSNSVEKKVVSGPYLAIPDKIITLNRVVSRRSLAANGESLVSPLVQEDDGKDVAGETKSADDMISSLPITPVAKLSEDSDEDSVGDVFEEDDGFSGVARIESEVLEGLVLSEDLNGVLGGDEDISIIESDSLKNDNIGDLVSDEGPHIGGNAKATSVVESEVSLMSGSSVVDGIEKYSVEEIHALENMVQMAELDDIYSMDVSHNASVLRTSTTEGETAGSFKSKEVVEGGQTEDPKIDESSSAIYFTRDTSLLETDKVVDSIVEFEFVDITELGLQAGKVVEEKNVSETQGGEVYKPGAKCDIKDSVYKKNEEADQDVNVNAVCVYDINCETNGSDVNKSEIFSLEIKSDEVENIVEQDTDLLDGQIPRSSDSDLMENELCCSSSIHQPGSLCSDSDRLEVENKDEVAHNLVQSKEEEDSCSEDSVTLGESNTLENIIACGTELVLTSHSISGGDSSHDHSKPTDEHFVAYIDEDADLAEESGREIFFDSASFSGVPDVARGSESVNSVAVTFPDDSGLIPLEKSADLNSSISSTKPTSHDHLIISTSTGLDPRKILAEEEINKLDVQQIRVKYLRLVQRLGLSAENSVAAQVLYWLDLAIGRSSSPGHSQETAKREALEFEASDKNEIDFSLNILIIGKSGVGKSATINSIFGREKTITDPFKSATTAVKEIVGTVDGIKVRVLDTPGLGTSLEDESLNKKILKSIGRFTKNCRPDVVIYVDRLDMQSQDLNDLLLLRSITSSLGSSLWHKTIITLTHAASTPPNGPSGEPLSYEKFVALRSHVIQQLICHAIGEQNMLNAGAVNQVCLVENQGMCKKSRDVQVLLPNGEAWKPQLLLLCYSLKILSELNTTVKAYKTLDVNKLFGFLVPSPPLPRFLSHKYKKFSADEAATFGKKSVLVGRNTELVMCAGINKKSEFSVSISSSEQLHIPLMVLLSIVGSIFSKFFGSVGKDD